MPSCRYVVEAILKKNKKANIKPYMVKNHLRVFVNARINNPTFDSQVSEPCALVNCFEPATDTSILTRHLLRPTGCC